MVATSNAAAPPWFDTGAWARTVLPSNATVAKKIFLTLNPSTAQFRPLAPVYSQLRSIFAPHCIL